MELKACRCCFGYDPYVYFSVMDGWAVYCPGCGELVTGGIDKEDAIDAWNRRVGEGEKE